MASIKQFKLQSDTSKSTLEQLADYYAKNLPIEVRQDMCTEMNQCVNGALCVSDLSLPLGYACKCPAGYFTYNCNYSKSTCL